MHYRLYIDPQQRISGSLHEFTVDTSKVTSLTDFSENQTLYFGVEWCSPIVASEVDIDYRQNYSNPYALLLECDIPHHNTYQSWTRGTSSVITLITSHLQTGYHGLSRDSPYLQSSALCGITRSDVLAKRGQLSFRLLRSPTGSSTDVAPFQPISHEPWSLSIVFWSVEPHLPLSTFDHYHLWLNTGDRSSGTVQECRIPVDLTTFDMHIGSWQLAVSYISPVFHDTSNTNLSHGGLVLVSDTFGQPPHGNTNIIAYLNRSYRAVEARYYGYRQSTKSATSDTLGVPIRSSIDNFSEIELKLLSATDRSVPMDPENLKDFVICITLFRVD